MLYVGKDNNKNDVAIVADKEMKDKTIDINRINNRLIAIKLVVDEEIVDMVNAYAP